VVGPATGRSCPPNICRCAAVGELHTDPQELGREHITSHAGRGPVSPEDVRTRIMSFATKLVICDAGARPDRKLKALRVGIDVVDIHRPPLRARQQQFADRHPQWRALWPPGPRRRIDRLSLLKRRTRGRLKESAHTATLNALDMHGQMLASAGSAEDSSDVPTVQAPGMSHLTSLGETSTPAEESHADEACVSDGMVMRAVVGRRSVRGSGRSEATARKASTLGVSVMRSQAWRSCTRGRQAMSSGAAVGLSSHTRKELACCWKERTR
jgi:hypothetical protein